MTITLPTRRVSWLRRGALAAALGAATLVLLPATAGAHVTLRADSTASGSFSALTFRVPKLESSETMSSPARFGFWTLRSPVIQTRGASSFIPRWKGSSFIKALNSLSPSSSSIEGIGPWIVSRCAALIRGR